MVETTRRKRRFIRHMHSPKGQYIHQQDGGQSFGRPKASAKDNSPWLHGAEHQRRSWKIDGCPGQSPGRRRRIAGAGKQFQKHYVPDGTTRRNDDDEELSFSSMHVSVKKTFLRTIKKISHAQTNRKISFSKKGYRVQSFETINRSKFGPHSNRSHGDTH